MFDVVSLIRKRGDKNVLRSMYRLFGYSRSEFIQAIKGELPEFMSPYEPCEPPLVRRYYRALFAVGLSPAQANRVLWDGYAQSAYEYFLSEGELSDLPTLGEGEKVDALLTELAEQINMTCGVRTIHGVAKARHIECYIRKEQERAALKRAAQEAAEDEDEAPF